MQNKRLRQWLMFVWVSLLLVGVLALAGCGGGESSPGQGQPDPSYPGYNWVIDGVV